jgi:hypothetical protein
MFELNREIADWRQNMRANGVSPVEALDELEGHLRDAFERKVQAGVERQEAFKLALEQLGRSTDLAAEFQKLHLRGWLPTRIAAAFILIALGGMIALLWSRVQDGGMELLLACHVFSITIGYFSALVFGGLGICYVGQRWARGFSTSHKGLLSRAALRFTGLSAVLTGLGIVLGALWAKEHFGRYWGWDIKEIGGLAVLSWLLLLLAVQCRSVGVHATMILGIGGNIVVALAWFGVNLVGHGAKSYGAALSYSLFSFIALNLVVLIIGLMPAGLLRLKQR